MAKLQDIWPKALYVAPLCPAGHLPRKGEIGLHRRLRLHSRPHVMTVGASRPVCFLTPAIRVGRDDQVGERRLRLQAVPGRVGFVALDIDAQGRARGAGAGQAEDDARAAFEQDADALVAAHRLVDRVVIGEIVGGGDRQRADTGSGQRRELAAQFFDKGVGALRLDRLVVMPGIVVAAIFGPVLFDDRLGAFACARREC